MRTLTDDTLSIQSGSSYIPLVKVTIGDSTFLSSDISSGLVSVETMEEGQSFTATIEIRPSVLQAIHPGIMQMVVGDRVSIKWGFYGSTDFIKSPPLFVVAVAGLSEPGSVLARFTCIGWWDLLASTRVVRDPGEIHDSGANEAATNTTLQDTDKSWGVNEHIGRVVTCNGKTMTVSSNTSDTLSGAAWSGGGNPGSPHSYSITSNTQEGAAAPPPVWDKDTTIKAILTEVLVGFGNVFLDDDDGIINTYRPYYEADGLESALTTVRNLLTMTLSYIRIRDDGFHIVYPQDTDSPNNTYNLDGHVFFTRTHAVKATIPNRIVMVPSLPSQDEAPAFVGVAIDQDSVDSLGFLDMITEDIGMTSEGEANSRAYYVLQRLKAEGVQGLAVVPMHIGQELYDRVEIIDARIEAVPIYNFVGSIKKSWASGIYSMEIGLGGLMPHLSSLPSFLSPGPTQTPPLTIPTTPPVSPPPSGGWLPPEIPWWERVAPPTPVFGPPEPVFRPVPIPPPPPPATPEPPRPRWGGPEIPWWQR